MPRPPVPLLQWLLRIVSSRDAADAAVGDILEELAERDATGRGTRLPWLWVNLQACRAIAAQLLARAPRLTRAAGLLARDATRGIRAAPGHALFVVAVLAAAVAAATVTFSVVDAVMLKPLPLEQPEQLVSIPTRDRGFKERITPELYWRLHDRLRSVEQLSTRMTFSGSYVTVAGLTDEWAIMHTNADIFQMLRWSPAIGRFWSAGDEQGGETNVAVLSHRFWRQQFDRDPSVLGRTVVMGRATRRIIGVLPAASDHPELEEFVPPIWVPAEVPRAGKGDPFSIIARMRPGVTPAQVAEEIRNVAGTSDWQPTVTPLLQTYVERVRHWMLLALGAAALVVIIACVNAANLMLTRFTRRAQEIAVRASLGASRRQIVGTVFAEGLLLSLAATASALLLSTIGIRAARTAIETMLQGIFRASMIALNGRVLAAAIAAGVLTGLAVSLVPAWQMSRAPVSSLLKDADVITSTGRRGWRGILLTTEIAAVAVLLVASWLFVLSLIRVAAIDLGIDTGNLVAVKPRMAFRGTVDEVRQRIARLPGVSGVAVSTGASLPLIGRAFSGAWITTRLRPADGLPASGAASPVTTLQYRVTPNYFDVAGVRFKRGGRWPADAGARESAVVLDEQAARLLFGDTEALGRQVRATEPEGIYTVVGIVPRVYARGPEESDLPAAYFALKPSPTRIFAGLFVRTTRPPEAMVPVITEALRPIAPEQKERYVFAAGEAVSRVTATRRFNAGMMSAFGLIAMLIGAAGVYAAMASFVVQQTREIGVRVALGATPARIRREVLALASRYLIAGIALGLPVAWWLSRGFTSLLFQVTPADPSVYAGVIALLSVGGVMAAWIPARRAARLDPIQTLRR